MIDTIKSVVDPIKVKKKKKINPFYLNLLAIFIAFFQSFITQKRDEETNYVVK